MKPQFNELDSEAIVCGGLKECLKTFTKDSKDLQAHDYMIIEDPDFKGEIIDVGCGPGKLAIMAKLKNPNSNITLFDGSVINIEIAIMLFKNAGLTEYLNKSIIFGLGVIGVEFNKQYDTVVLNHIVEHLDDLDSSFDWIMNITKPGGTIFIAVPYKDCHFSDHHKYYFKVSTDKDNHGIIYKDSKCFDIDTYLNKRGYNIEITVFDESKVDERHPHDSRGQLDMLIKIKKPESGIVTGENIASGPGEIDPDFYKKPLPSNSIIENIPL